MCFEVQGDLRRRFQRGAAGGAEHVGSAFGARAAEWGRRAVQAGGVGAAGDVVRDGGAWGGAGVSGGDDRGVGRRAVGAGFSVRAAGGGAG